MAFKVFSAGATLPASDVNDYLMEQAVIACTSATRPSSPNEGMTIYETDTDKTLQYSGSAWVEIARLGAWTAFTPTLAGTGWAIGNGTASGRWVATGRTVFVHMEITFGSTSTFGAGALTLSLPVNAQAVGYHGVCSARDVSAGTRYPGICSVQAVGTVTPQVTQYDGTAGATAYATQNGYTTNGPFTWANTDQLFLDLTYESA